ncbi:S1C family serine protease [Anaerolentibacter hominis]|uniref:S1C family serine protease n=1 Tax=Anaerolentibacter hominis TaxID=3079009 RepID=UPI0031B84811
MNTEEDKNKNKESFDNQGTLGPEPDQTGVNSDLQEDPAIGGNVNFQLVGFEPVQNRPVEDTAGSNVTSSEAQQSGAAAGTETTSAGKEENPYHFHIESNSSDGNKTDGAMLSSAPSPKEPKKKSGVMKKIVLFVCGALLFGALTGAAFWGGKMAVEKMADRKNDAPLQQSEDQEDEGEASNLPAKKLETTPILEDISSDNQIVPQVVENVLPSVVSISSQVTEVIDFFGRQYTQEGSGSGSGIIAGQNDDELLIITNHHVIKGADKIIVTFVDGKSAEAIVKGSDSAADLAVLSLDTSNMEQETLDAIKVAALGDSDAVKVGEMSIVIGNALGYGQTTTVGYIGARDRQVQVDGRKMTLLQTGAAINPGNSGGPMLNIKGEVIGIASVKYADEQVEGMGYAIPISSAMPIIEDLMEREKLTDEERGYLGITGNTVEDNMIKYYHMPEGASVYSIVDGGPADKAGIKVGDIITKVNGIAVNSMEALKERVNGYKAGTTVTITIARGDEGEYKESDVQVVLADEASLNTSDNSGTTQTPTVPNIPDSGRRKAQ